MATHIIADRVKETTTFTSTASILLSIGATAGFQAFSAVMASNDTCVYGIAQSASSWEVGIGTYNATVPSLVRTTILASSNAGAAVNFGAGTKDVYITTAAERFMLPQMAGTTDPGAPDSGVFMYSRVLGGRHVPRWIGPSGLDTAVQPCMWGNCVVMWLPSSTTAASVQFGVGWTVSTTQSTPSIASTNFMTQVKRAVFTTTTTAANTSGIRSTTPVAWRGNVAGQGGFFFSAQFGITTYSATMRVFVGLAEQTAALASDPNTMSNAMGVAKMTGQTSWVIVTCGSAGSINSCTSTATNVICASGGASAVYNFFMFARPNDSLVTYSFMDDATGTWAVTNTVVGPNNIPLNTAMLTAHAECQNVTGGAGTAIAMFLSKLYVETDN